MNTTVLLVLALSLGFASTAFAQDPAPPPEEEPIEEVTTEPAQGGPTNATSDVVIDDRQRQLDEEQRALEGEDHPADEVVDPNAPPPPPADSMSHRNQLGIRVGVAQPYVFAIKYGEGPPCGSDGETFCRRFGAAALDLDLAFGITQQVEISLSTAIGLTDDDAARAAPLGFGFGIRSYGSPDSMVKLFFGGRLVLDITSSDVPAWKTIDFGVRGELGLAFDFIRYLGAYIQMGETLRFLRGLYFVTDLSGGLQVRFP